MYRICLLLIVFLSGLSSAGTLFRLPVKSNVDSAVTAVFAAALDSLLSRQFTIQVITDQNQFSPESTICSSEIFRTDSHSVLFSFDLFLQEEHSAIAASVRLPNDSLQFKVIFFAIRRALAATDYNRLTLARLQVVGTDGALVSLNSEVAGRIPMETFLPSGIYQVAISGPQLIRRDFPLSLSAGRDTVIVADLLTPTRITAFGTGGVGLLCALTAVLLNQIQLDRYDRYMQTRDAAQYDDLYGDYKSAIIGRNIAFGISSLFMISGIAVYFDIPFTTKISLNGR